MPHPLIVIGLLLGALFTVGLGIYVYYREPYPDTFTYNEDEESLDDYEADYFSDIHDLIKEDGDTELDGQMKLWETGQLPVIDDGAPLRRRFDFDRPATISEVTDETSSRNWWDDYEPGDLAALHHHLSAALAAANGSEVPSMEDREPEQPQAVTGPPSAVSAWQQVDTSQHRVIYDEVEDFTGEFEFNQHKLENPTLYLDQDEYLKRAADDLKLWSTQQQIAQAQWRAEVGLDCE